MPTRLKDFAAAAVAAAAPETTALAAAKLVRKHHVGALVVVDALQKSCPVGRLLGIITMKDILELLTRELADLAIGVISARDRAFEHRA